MHDAGVKVLAKPEMQAALKKIGVETIPMQSKAMDDLVAREVVANIELLKNVK
jgi:tripartite-type tricarboxylate transporter receptor subunit TctC